MTRSLAIGTLVLVASTLDSQSVIAQTPAGDDPIRGAALVHLATELFRADPNPARLHCVAAVDADLDRPPADPLPDPSPGLLDLVRSVVPHALPYSACPLPAAPAVTQTAAAVEAHGPIAYYVGPVRRVGRTAYVTVAYRLHGLNGGGWTCELRAGRSTWRVHDCMPVWIS